MVDVSSQVMASYNEAVRSKNEASFAKAVQQVALLCDGKAPACQFLYRFREYNRRRKKPTESFLSCPEEIIGDYQSLAE